MNWTHVDQLAKKHGIDSDAELARRGLVNQSVITRARQGVVGERIVAALRVAFPKSSMRELFIYGTDQ